MRLCLPYAALVLFSGCIPASSLGSGRTVGEDVSTTDVSVTSGAYSDVSVGGDRDPFLRDSSDAPVPLDYVPIIEIGMTYGVGPRAEVSVRMNSTSSIGVRAKGQVAGTADSPFAVATGAEGHINVGLLSFGGLYGYGSTFATVSYHPSPQLAAYATLRYTAVGITVDHPGSRPSSVWSYPSLTYGVAVGKGDRFTAEVSHTRSGFGLPSQVSVGYRFTSR